MALPSGDQSSEVMAPVSSVNCFVVFLPTSHTKIWFCSVACHPVSPGLREQLERKASRFPSGDQTGQLPVHAPACVFVLSATVVGREYPVLRATFCQPGQMQLSAVGGQQRHAT